MKVLQVNKYFHPKSGAERSLFNTCALLEKNGHEVIHFSMKHASNLPSGYERYFVEEIDYSKYAGAGVFTKARMFFKLIYSAEAARKMGALLDDEKPDIAHIHKFNQVITPSILAPLKKRGIPIVQTFRDYKRICPNYNLYDFSRKEICEACRGGRYYSPVLRRCLAPSFTINLNIALEAYFYALTRAYDKIDTCICPSRFMLEKSKEHGVPEEKLVHIPNFLHIAEFQPSEPTSTLIVYIGRIEHHKGVKTLMDAVSGLRGASLVIGGDGSGREELEKYAAGKGLSGIKFAGHLPLEEVKRLVGESLFTVVPSEWYENFGMSVIESFACCRAVIGARTGGIPEIIDDGENGFLFQPGNVEELREKMARLLESPALAGEMGMKGRRKAEREYNPDLFYERLMKVYSKLVY